MIPDISHVIQGEILYFYLMNQFKRFIALLSFLSAASLANAQYEISDRPHFSKVTLGYKGCYAYMPNTITLALDSGNTGDNIPLYSAAAYTADTCNWDIFLLELQQPIPDSSTQLLYLEALLAQIKEQYKTTQCVGLAKGHTTPRNAKMRGMVDYCVDAANNKIQLKGWVNRQFIAIGIIKGVSEPPYDLSELFKNGIYLPN